VSEDPEPDDAPPGSPATTSRREAVCQRRPSCPESPKLCESSPGGRPGKPARRMSAPPGQGQASHSSPYAQAQLCRLAPGWRRARRRPPGPARACISSYHGHLSQGQSQPPEGGVYAVKVARVPCRRRTSKPGNLISRDQKFLKLNMHKRWR
jgi:hypothetical protein